MKRLIQGKGLNSPEEYDRIFRERQKKGADWFDLKRWKKLIKYAPKKGVFLDAGCLDSLAIPLIKRRNPELWCLGLDTSRLAIWEMQANYGWSGNYIVRDIYNIKLSNEIIDYVIMGEVIEHLEYPKKAIEECFRVLKPGGMLALSTPLEEHDGEFDKDRHIWSFSKQDIRELLEPYGKVKIRTLGSNYFPYRYHPRCIIVYCEKT